MKQWNISVSDALDDLKAQIVAKLDVYEFLDALEFDMNDLVEALHDTIVEKRANLEDALV